MERMEVDQCAGAAAGALRRSISAPMIPSGSERMAACSPDFWVRQRRGSVNCSCPSQEDKMESSLEGGSAAVHRIRVSCQLPAPPDSPWHQSPSEWFRSADSGVTPNSSPSPTRRFRPVDGVYSRWPAITPLKRKGGAESDGPPKKLFVTAVLDPAHNSSYTISASAADSASRGVGPLSSPAFTPSATRPPH
ncbi:uncharacterized protein LOC133492053 [Syngnathoides biaculeatus]|uniref:uncharacterized protein LOC133492053 n=1 Tax=Syngnathoides biaculeatus TaxID=300417 RepID=UPI002ADD61AC|nr:uncharacterized protein LOC133492053 [Syngnathoides biaculeatus]